MDKNLGLGVLRCAYVGYFWCLIPWVWFGVIQCTFQNFQFYNFLKTLLLSQFSSDSSKLYTRYHNHTLAVTFYGDLPKIAKIMALWNFLNTGPYGAGIFNFSHNFHWSPSKLSDNIGYHGKSKCLLEYWNEKLVSSTWDNIILFYLKFLKHSCVLGLQFKQSVKAPGPLVSNPFYFLKIEILTIFSTWGPKGAKIP